MYKPLQLISKVQSDLELCNVIINQDNRDNKKLKMRKQSD